MNADVGTACKEMPELREPPREKTCEEIATDNYIECPKDIKYWASTDEHDETIMQAQSIPESGSMHKFSKPNPCFSPNFQDPTEVFKTQT